MNFSSCSNGLRTMLVIVSLCAGLLGAHPSAARTLAEVKALGAISMCANPDALPFASDQVDSPGFQIELGREIAKQREQTPFRLKRFVEWRNNRAVDKGSIMREPLAKRFPGHRHTIEMEERL